MTMALAKVGLISELLLDVLLVLALEAVWLLVEDAFPTLEISPMGPPPISDGPPAPPPWLLLVAVLDAELDLPVEVLPYFWIMLANSGWV